MFTKHTRNDITWSGPRDHIECDLQTLNMTPIACCVAVSERHGLDLVKMWPKSVDTTKFHEYLDELKTKYPERKMCIYLDNLGIHRSKATKEVFEKHQMLFVFNPPYAPFGNPIEECFAVVKQDYKKAKLNRIVNGTDYTNEELVTNAFKKVSSGLV